MAVSAIDGRRIAASLRLLAAASRELSTSFDYAQTLAAVGRLVVPEYAGGFAVEADEGEIRTTLAQSGSLDENSRVMPLVARNRTVGLMRVAGMRDDDTAEIDIWDELALRIAV